MTSSKTTPSAICKDCKAHFHKVIGTTECPECEGTIVPLDEDTNSPVCSDSKEDANKLEMMSKETMKEYYEVGCWAGNAQMTIHKLLIHVAKVQDKLEVCQNFKTKTFPELESDSFDAGYARAVKDMKEALSHPTL